MKDLLKFTKSSLQRFRSMAGALGYIDGAGIEGDVVECGVWRGGNIILARQRSPGRVCWLYDTFAGMTKPEPVDLNRTGGSALEKYPKKTADGNKWMGVSIDEVKNNFKLTETYDEDKLRFVEGDVEKTLLVKENLPEKIALLRLDTDWHNSTKVELEVLFPLLRPGGILIVDDYGHWIGARKAVNDYFARNNFTKPANNAMSLTAIDYTAVMMIKI